MIDDTLQRLRQQYADELQLAHLVEAGVDALPIPGKGHTLARWQVLAEVAAHDLSLAKLFEGHTDALAILDELSAEPPAPNSRWGTWCAEPPDARVTMQPANDGRVRLQGTKAWCSGAASVTHAVMSCWNEAGEPCLVAVAMDQPGVKVTGEGWMAVGMAGSASVNVLFNDAIATPVGKPGDYTRRAGFWHGGAGIAACWFGGALGIARVVRQLSAPASDVQRLAHVGAIDVAISSASAVLREVADWIDAHPKADAHRLALRARLLTEEHANVVMLHAGRAVGAGPLCRNPRFARAMADLPVYLRQSHAERDLTSLGRSTVDPEAPPWAL